MHLAPFTVDRGLSIVLTLLTGAALFAAEACLGPHPGTATAGKDAGAPSAVAQRVDAASDLRDLKESTKPTVRDDARQVLAESRSAGERSSVDTVARHRRGDAIDRAR